jgi:hypothetical protein
LLPRISLWMAAYRRSMPVKSYFPLRCLHSTVLSASALVVSSFHTAHFPFKRGKLWISCTNISRTVRTSHISSLQSGVLLSGLHVSCQTTQGFRPTVFRTQSDPPSLLLRNTPRDVLHGDPSTPPLLRQTHRFSYWVKFSICIYLQVLSYD